MTVNRENVQKWVDALRSGEYTQGQNALLSPEGEFCCLGVACDISGLGEWKRSEFVAASFVPHRLDDPSTFPARSFLPYQVGGWLGIRSIDPKVKVDGRLDRRLSDLNDEGVPFDMIADAIERTFLTGDPA